MTKKKKRQFQAKFLPDGLKWEEHGGPDDLIQEKLKIATETYPIYTSYFFQVGLRIPFNPYWWISSIEPVFTLATLPQMRLESSWV